MGRFYERPLVVSPLYLCFKYLFFTALEVQLLSVSQAIANRLNDILSEEASKNMLIQNSAEERKKESKTDDEEEDYLDESE